MSARRPTPSTRARAHRRPGDVELLALHSEPLDDALRARIHGLVTGAVALRELLQLDRLLGERFAAAALAPRARPASRSSRFAASRHTDRRSLTIRRQRCAAACRSAPQR